MRTVPSILLTLAFGLGCASETAAPEKAAPSAARCGSKAKLALAATTTTAGVYYDPDIRVMMSAYCTRCHAGQTPPALGELESVKAAAQASLASMRAGRMPRGERMPAGEIERFQTWIDDGFPATPPPKTTGTSTGTSKAPRDDEEADTDEPEATWLGGVSQLIERACLDCHGPKDRKPDLSTYAKVKAEAEDVLDSVRKKRMPPGGPAFKKDELRLLQDWIEDDFPRGAATDDEETDDDDACRP